MAYVGYYADFIIFIFARGDKFNKIQCLNKPNPEKLTLKE